MTGRDALTGLPTRPGVLQWLTHAQAVSPISGPGDATAPAVVLAAVDIEDFAGVNVEYGQAGGDEVLRVLAGRLLDLAGDGGIAARVGGDAFVVGVRTPGVAAKSLADAVLGTVHQSVAIGDRSAVVGGNVAAVECESMESIASIVRRLELALDRARRMSGQTVVVADALEEDRFRAALAADLSQAVERDEIRVHYLPIVSLELGVVLGVEALARWHRPDGVLDMSEFLEQALRTGQIVAIGRYAMEQACREVAAWNKDHPGEPPLRLSLNVSLQQLRDPSVVHVVEVLLATSGLEPSLLCLELSEDTVSELGDDGAPTLAALKALGLRLSVDDFGTGASSLVALRRHRFDELKIDRSFVALMDEDPDAAAIVRGVARLATSLGLDLVAEGVERPAQDQMLRSLRCQAAQGYLYARPGPDLDEVIGLAGGVASSSKLSRPASHEELWAGLPTPRSAARFVEAVFESAPIGMALIDHTGVHLAANPAAGLLLDRTVEDLLGKTCWELIHPADLQADLDGMDSLLRGEQISYVVDERVMAPDGTTRWVEVTVSGIAGEHHAEGMPTRLLRQVRGIEDDRRADEDAAALRSIIAASPGALIITDARGLCTHWNPAAEQLFGWSAEDMIGRSLSRLVAAADQITLARVLGEAAGGRAVAWPDATWLAASGAPCCIDLTIGPIQGGDGLVRGLVALARDVTDQRTADLALREAHEALEARAGQLVAANDRLAAFATTLSHDLLQPVAALDGFLTLLDMHATELDDEHRDWLGRALRGKDRITEAITALHRHASADDVELEPVPVGEVVEELLGELPLVREGGAAEVGDLPVVLADRGLLTQVFANLLQNALRYRSPRRPLHLRVDATADGAMWEVVVSDTGRGIDPEELSTVFDRGVRGRSARGTPGTGTGLATVRSLVQQMGGDVWAEPSDVGARLCVRLQGLSAQDEGDELSSATASAT